MKKQKDEWEELNLQCFKKAYTNCKTAILTEAIMLQDSIPTPPLAPAEKDA